MTLRRKVNSLVLLVVPYSHFSLCNLRVLCVSVVNKSSKNSPQRHREHGGCAENFILVTTVLLAVVQFAGGRDGLRYDSLMLAGASC
jgi:hypothetical protein